MLWRNVNNEVMRCHTQSRAVCGVFFSRILREESKADVSL